MGGEYPDNAEYNKLVRDKIPEIVTAKGLMIETRKLSNEDTIKELYKKIVEEAVELSAADNRAGIINEIADVLEVVYSLSERSGISLEEIEETRLLKAEKRGSFKNGVFVIRTYKEEK